MEINMSIFRNFILVIFFGIASYSFATDYPVDCNSLQASLSVCSSQGYTCVIQPGEVCTATGPVYMWGNSSLVSSNEGGITFNQTSPSPYLFNLGISGPQNPNNRNDNLASPFTGKISGVTFRMAGAQGAGRLIYLWRTDGAIIHGNIFEIGSYNYSATSSGNNNNWVYNGQTVRNNVTISNNKIYATSAGNAPSGNEGIGLNLFTGAKIVGNTVIGVGDDPIGIHFSSNVEVLSNVLESTHGRIFVSNSDNVEIAYNTHTRIPSLADNNFYKGISLLYAGFERYQIDGTQPYYASENFYIHDNLLRYPAGAIDTGAAIYLYAPRNFIVSNNVIVNDATPGASSHLAAIYVLPAVITSTGNPAWWIDPTGIDSTSTIPGNPKIHAVTVENNISTGTLPLSITSSGNCSEYVGPVQIINNIASPDNVVTFGYEGYKFYCQNETQGSNNRSTSNTLINDF